MLLRNSFLEQSVNFNSNRDQLLRELTFVEKAMEPIQKELENCQEMANHTSTRVAFGFFATIGLQFALS